MTKAELTERIIDAITDAWTDDPLDYLDSTPTNLAGAVQMLADVRENESLADLTPEEKLPDSVTPEDIMETYNCLIKARKHEAHIQLLSEYLSENPDFLAYFYSYLPKCHPANGPVDIVPMDMFIEHLQDGNFYFDTTYREYSKAEILKAFAEGLSSFDTDAQYVCFYDCNDAFKLSTTNDPVEIVRPDDFATAVFDDKESLKSFIKDVIEDNAECKRIFRCTKLQLMKGENING